MVSPDWLTNERTKVPKGCLEGFRHFWHLVTLGISRTARPPTQHTRDGYLRTRVQKEHPAKTPGEIWTQRPWAKQYRSV